MLVLPHMLRGIRGINFMCVPMKSAECEVLQVLLLYDHILTFDLEVSKLIV